MKQSTKCKGSTTFQEAPQHYITALKALIDDGDLERLETVLDRFNIFESLSLVRQEIRHSDFLRWILAPNETHGLGDYWLRQFLRKIIKSSEGIRYDGPSLFDLDGWDLTQAEVRREWHRIDILIRDDLNQFVCVVENKVDSTESGDQLERYRDIVEQEFSQYRKAFVFLTKFGEPPSDHNYVSLCYSDLASTIEDSLRRRENQLNDEIKLFVQHYLDMVGRNIVQNSELQALCNKIYKNHRRALDLIFEHRPDRAAEVAQVIRNYITSKEDLIAYSLNGKTYLLFLPKCMDIPQLKIRETRMLVWLLVNQKGSLQFRLQLGPGPKQQRENVYALAKRLPSLFGKQKPNLSPEYHALTRTTTWITEDKYETLTNKEIEETLDKEIQDFLEKKGKAIANALIKLPKVTP